MSTSSIRTGIEENTHLLDELFEKYREMSEDIGSEYY